MKRVWPIVLLAVLLLGCSASDETERGLAVRTKIQSAQGCSFTAAITADYGETLYSFEMECRFDQQGNMSFCVTAPETVAGISGTVSAEGGRLVFDETVLAFSLMAEDQLSPVGAPWILMKSLRGGYLRSCWEEQGMLCMSLDESYADNALQTDLWLNGEACPTHGDILWEGRRILTLDITDFLLE